MLNDSSNMTARCENRDGQVPMDAVVPRVKQSLHRLSEGTNVRVRPRQSKAWENKKVAVFIPRPFRRYRDVSVTIESVTMYRTLFNTWLFDHIGHFERPAGPVIFHYEVAHELDALEIRKWDANNAYEEICWLSRGRKERMVTAFDVARALLYEVNSPPSEKTKDILIRLLLDYCKRKLGRYVALAEIATTAEGACLYLHGCP